MRIMSLTLPKSCPRRPSDAEQLAWNVVEER